MDGVALEGPLICDEAIIQQAQNFSMNPVVPNTSLGFDIEKVPRPLKQAALCAHMLLLKLEQVLTYTLHRSVLRAMRTCREPSMAHSTGQGREVRMAVTGLSRPLVSLVFQASPEHRPSWVRDQHLLLLYRDVSTLHIFSSFLLPSPSSPSSSPPPSSSFCRELTCQLPGAG